MHFRRHVRVLPDAAVGHLHFERLGRAVVTDRANLAGADLPALHGTSWRCALPSCLLRDALEQALYALQRVCSWWAQAFRPHASKDEVDRLGFARQRVDADP